jgi:hypothetical protein
MFWVIRWTDLDLNEDRAIVVEAKSAAQAETMAQKRGIPVVHIGVASDADIEQARQARLLWRYTRDASYRCFGRAVSRAELVCLMLCGVWTIGVLLRNTHVIA